MTGTYDPPPGRYSDEIQTDIIIAHLARDDEYRDQMIRRLRPMQRVRLGVELQNLTDAVAEVIRGSD